MPVKQEPKVVAVVEWYDSMLCAFVTDLQREPLNCCIVQFKRHVQHYGWTGEGYEKQLGTSETEKSWDSVCQIAIGRVHL